jgi:deoxyribodipyrimidine photo-lyase
MSAGLSGALATRIDVVYECTIYDPNHNFVRLWVPELRALPAEFVHEPWKMSLSQQEEHKVELGVDYPLPIVQASYLSAGEMREQRLARRTMKLTREQLKNQWKTVQEPNSQ